MFVIIVVICIYAASSFLCTQIRSRKSNPSTHPPCCYPPIEPEAQRKRATATFHSSSSTGFSQGAYFESSIIPDTHTHAHRHQQPPAGNSISSSSSSLRSQQREWFSQSVFLQHQWRTSLIATARNPPPPEQETPQSTRTRTHARAHTYERREAPHERVTHINAYKRTQGPPSPPVYTVLHPSQILEGTHTLSHTHSICDPVPYCVFFSH